MLDIHSMVVHTQHGMHGMRTTYYYFVTVYYWYTTRHHPLTKFTVHNIIIQTCLKARLPGAEEVEYPFIIS